jgi:hypothetical protein
MTSQQYLIRHAEHDIFAFGKPISQTLGAGNPALNANFFGTKGIAKPGDGMTQAVVLGFMQSRICIVKTFGVDTEFKVEGSRSIRKESANAFG